MSQGDAEFSYTTSYGDIKWKREFDQDNTNFVITFHPENAGQIQDFVYGFLSTNAEFTGPNKDIGFARVKINPGQQYQDSMTKMMESSGMISAKIPAVIERMSEPDPDKPALRYFLPRRLLLRIRSEFVTQADTILEGYGLKDRIKYASDGLYSATFPLTQGQSELRMLFNAVEKYQNKDFESVEPHQVDFRVAQAVVPPPPDDPYYTSGQQWALRHPNVAYRDRDIQAPEAWNLTTGTPNVVIAVLDTGIDTNHPDLVGKVVDQFNAITGATTLVSVEDMDPNGHGTKVSGVIGANTDNTLQIAGVAWDCGLFPIKIDDNLITLDYAKVTVGIDKVRTKAVANVSTKRYVMNLSVKFDGYYGTVYTAIQNAYNQGVVIVASAADESKNVITPPITYPPFWSSLLIPVGGHRNLANCPKVASSNWNDSAIIAPGEGILTTIKGGGIPQTVFGTSFAAALVSGVAALCFSRYYQLPPIGFPSGLTPQLLRDRVRNCILGNTKTWTNPTTPFRGRIDAYAAVNAMWK